MPDTPCPACAAEPCVCDFTADELAEAGRALTPEELLEVERIRVQKRAQQLH